MCLTAMNSLLRPVLKSSVRVCVCEMSTHKHVYACCRCCCWPLKQKGPRLPSWGSILMAPANAANVNLRKCCPGMCVCVRVCVLVCCGWQHLCNIICGQFHFSERLLWLRPFSLLAPKPINCCQAKPSRGEAGGAARSLFWLTN